LNPGRRGGKPATNRLSYGAAVSPSYIISLFTEQFPSNESAVALYENLYNPPSIKDEEAKALNVIINYNNSNDNNVIS
jgi:hypothetical protein